MLSAIKSKSNSKKNLSSIKGKSKTVSRPVSKGSIGSKKSSSKFSTPKDISKVSREATSRKDEDSSRVSNITAGLLGAWGSPADSGSQAPAKDDVLKVLNNVQRGGGESKADRQSKINRPWLDDESLAEIRDEQRDNRLREEKLAKELKAERAAAQEPSSDVTGPKTARRVKGGAEVDTRSNTRKAWDGLTGFVREGGEVLYDVSDHINDVTQDHIHSDNPNAIWNPDENRLENRDGNSYWTGRPFND